MRRSVGVAALLAGVVAVAAGGYLAGTRIQSAAEIAARKAPPPPSVITVPVERTVLSTEVITRGTVQFGLPREVTLPISALKSGSRVVSSVGTPGTSIKEGDVALSVSGRPVFVLQGAQPAYRDLAPGTSGEDVRQLQAALARMGFEPGAVDGLFDEATSSAVERWYASAGWNAQGPTQEQLTAQRGAEADARQAGLAAVDAEEAVRLARAGLDTARARLRLAQLGIGTAKAADSASVTAAMRARLAAEAEIARLEGQVRVAQEGLRTAELQYVEARDGTTSRATPSELAVLEAEVRLSASQVSQTEAELEAARAAARANNLTASTEVASKRRALDEALRAVPPDRPAVDAARAELVAAEARADATARTGASDEAVKRRAVETAGAQKVAAQARLSDARSGRTRPASAGEVAAKKDLVTAAQETVRTVSNDLARSRATLSTSPGEGTAGAAATAAVELETGQREVASATSAVEIAERRAGLVRLRPTSGTLAPGGFQVPADEVLFFPSLPLRIQSVAVRLGDRVEGPVMTVATSRLVVSGALTAADAQVTKVGSPVRIVANELGLSATGTVAEVAQSPGTQGADAQRFYLAVNPSDVPGSLAGASVVLTISVGSTEGEVLVVPVAALSVAADGSSRVLLQTAPGTVTAVTVRAGLSARGMVEITVVSGSLRPGDLVVVGSPATGKTTAK